MHTKSQPQTQIIFRDVLSRIKQRMDGESVYAFAKRLGISQQTADCYIKGKRKPSLDFIYRVCSVYGCSADELLGLPTVVSERSVIGDLNELRAQADQAQESLSNLLAAIDKFKKETRR